MNDDHPVIFSLLLRLRELENRYVEQPSAFNRYQLVRHEQRLAEWAPLLLDLA